MTTKPVADQVQDTLKSAHDVRDAVHGITVRALAEGRLDGVAIKQVVESVLKGVGAGATQLGSTSSKTVGEALQGLDDALAGAAKATQLALQEAIGRAGEFSREELQRSLDEMKNLESNLLLTLTRSAGSTGRMAAETMSQFAAHARLQGTAVGRQVAATLPKLSAALATVAQAQVDAGVGSLRHGSALLTGMASGILTGMAERLQGTVRPEAATQSNAKSRAKPNPEPTPAPAPSAAPLATPRKTTAKAPTKAPTKAPAKVAVKTAATKPAKAAAKPATTAATKTPGKAPAKTPAKAPVKAQAKVQTKVQPGARTTKAPGKVNTSS